MLNLRWHRFFPRARDIEIQMLPSRDTEIQLFAGVRLRPIALTAIEEEFAPDIAMNTVRSRLRMISTFEHLSEQETADGIARMDAAVAGANHMAPVTASRDISLLG